MTHFLYREKPTQQTYMPHTHTPTHTHTRPHTHTHSLTPTPTQNLRRMSHKCVHIYKNTNQHICASAASSPWGAEFWMKSLSQILMCTYTHTSAIIMQYLSKNTFLTSRCKEETHSSLGFIYLITITYLV